jgi:hypothetical protein
MTFFFAIINTWDLISMSDEKLHLYHEPQLVCMLIYKTCFININHYDIPSNVIPKPTGANTYGAFPALLKE